MKYCGLLAGCFSRKNFDEGVNSLVGEMSMEKFVVDRMLRYWCD